VQNTWNYVGFTFDIAGSANEVIQIYKGNLTTVAAEISYAYRTDGSGTLNSDAAANFSIGNASGYGAAWPGTIAWFAHWNRVLTLAEVVEQQFNPHVTSGCVLFMHLGYNGTGTQPDWSGNGNNGTVTSATVSDHVPLGPMLRTRRRSGYVVGGTIYTKSVSGSLTIAGVPVKKTKRSLSGVL
jgi:hypothetical protein